MDSELLNLDNLSEEEKLTILKVIKRDEDLRWAKNQQVNHLKNDIHNIRVKSILHDGDDLTKICARCHEPFGFFFNTGEICPQCRFKVCKKCREINLSGAWSCSLCFKQNQLKLLRGDWVKKVGAKKRGKFEHGGDVVKASIRRSLSEAGKNLQNKPPGSLLADDDGSPSLARAAGNHRGSTDRAGYPQETDKKRLHQLFESFRSNTTDSDSNASVKHVSCRRRRDSGSSSSSEEGKKGDNLYKSVCDSITSSEPGLIPSRPTSETESALNSPVAKPNKLNSKPIETTVPPELTNGNSRNLYDKARSSDTVSQSSSSENARFSSTESGQNAKRMESKIPQQTNQMSNLRPPSASPRQNVRLSPEHSNVHLRKGSGQSDTSSISSARTASPATKMRLLDLASSRALERDGSDGSDNDDSLRSRKNKKHSINSIKLTVTNEGSDETGSHGDSGHISGNNSLDNTPEHRASRQSHLSVPSLPLSTTSNDKVGNDSIDEEDENIDYLVASHRSMGSARSINSRGLSSLFSGSRESILSIYSDAGEINYGNIPVSGEVLLGIDYNYKTGALEIYVKQCKDLAPVDTKRKRSDPYIKTYLLPDKTRSGKRKTKIKKHTLNPVFDEVLRYILSQSEVENRILWIAVWNNDRFGHNDFLGEVTLSLDTFKFGDSSPKWYPLQERFEEPQLGSLMPYKGDLIISLRYITPDLLAKEVTKKSKVKKSKTGKGALHVMVKEARNLTALRSNGTSDPFCKGYLLPDKHKSGKQKTPTIKKNCNPIWNYLFVFEDLDNEELSERSLELTIWDHDTISSNDFLGGIRFNLGTGISEKNSVEWMDGRGEEIAIWQCMIDRPNTWIDACVNLRATMGKSLPKKLSN